MESTNNSKKIAWFLIVVVVIGLLFFGSKGDSIKKTSETGPIKVGFITPLSGGVASLGEPLKNVADLALEKINSEGGINGRKLELVYEDDQCSPSLAAAAINKLITTDKVNIVVGSTCSSAVSSILPIAKNNNVFVFSSSATNPNLTGISKLFARTVPSDSSQGKAMADYANKAGWKNVAVIVEISDYSKGIADVFENSYKNDTNKIVVETFSPDATEVRTQITKLIANKPDAIVLIPAGPATAQKIVNALKDLKSKTQIMTDDIYSTDSDVFMTNKSFMEGAVVAEINKGGDTPQYVAFKNAYKSKYNKDISYESYSQAQYDLVMILADALKKYGDDSEKVAKYVRTVNDYSGFSGTFSIDENGDRTGGHTLGVVKAGKYEIIK